MTVSREPRAHLSLLLPTAMRSMVTRSAALHTASVLLALSLVGCLERRDGDTTAAVDECSTCHGGLLREPFQSAPPFNLAGDGALSSRGNGAHEIHLEGSSTARAVACVECHMVPEELYAPGHIDTEYPAEIIFTGPGTAFKAEPAFDAETQSCKNTFCHGGSFVGFRPSGGTLTEPTWTSTDGAAAECGACHSLPPPLPHPIDSACSDCHKNIDEGGTFTRPELHVDGTVTFFLPSE